MLVIITPSHMPFCVLGRARPHSSLLRVSQHSLRPQHFSFHCKYVKQLLARCQDVFDGVPIVKDCGFFSFILKHQCTISKRCDLCRHLHNYQQSSTLCVNNLINTIGSMTHSRCLQVFTISLFSECDALEHNNVIIFAPKVIKTTSKYKSRASVCLVRLMTTLVIR